jgi:hypothetical protein
MQHEEIVMIIEIGTVSEATKGFQPGVQTDPAIAGKTPINVKRLTL